MKISRFSKFLLFFLLILFLFVVFYYFFLYFSIIGGVGIILYPKWIINLNQTENEFENNDFTGKLCSKNINLCRSCQHQLKDSLLTSNFSKFSKNIQNLLRFRVVQEEYLNEVKDTLCQEKRERKKKREKIFSNLFEVKERWNQDGVRLFLESTVVSWWENIVDPRKYEDCEVKCIVTDKFKDSDVYVSNLLHDSNLENYQMKLFLYLEQRFAQIHIDEDDFRHMNYLKSSDIFVGLHPFFDIPLFYDQLDWFESSNSSQKFFNTLLHHVMIENYKNKLIDNIKRKNKEAIGTTFISHCTAINERSNAFSYLPSYRSMYIYELEKYINIHSYGKCGKDHKDGGGSRWENVDGHRTVPVIKKILAMNEYKFHFCFENAIRLNYVTEKLMHALASVYTIPVYLGAVNIMDYFEGEILNYKFLIYANDYLNPKDLADYLNYLDRNMTAYMEYFQWRIDKIEIKFKDHIKDFQINEYSLTVRENKMGENMEILCRICKFYKKEKKKFLLKRNKLTKYN